MSVKENDIKKMLERIKTILPEFSDEHSIMKAAEQCDYMWLFPEDYNDEDFNVEDLTDQLNDLRWGFESLVDAMTGILKKYENK